MSEPVSKFTFSVERANTIPDKGVLVVGTCAGGEPQVGDRARFQNPEGEAREGRVVGVVLRVLDPKTESLEEGKTGMVLENVDRKDLRPPVTITGLPEAERAVS